MVDEEGQPSDGNHQELHPERVVVPVVGGLELGVDHVDGGVRTAYVDDLGMAGIDTHVSQLSWEILDWQFILIQNE